MWRAYVRLAGTLPPDGDALGPAVVNAVLERSGELAAIGAALDAVRGGRGGVVVVRAVAGLGKTSLLEAAGELAADLQVLRVTGAELERELPFGGALALLGDLLAAMALEERDALLDGPAAAAGPLLRGEALPTPSQPEAAQLAIAHGLHHVLAGLARSRPLVVVADDAHWLDAPTLRFLLYTARRAAEAGVLLLVGMRPGEPGAPVALLEGLLRAPGTVLLEPAPLSEAAAGQALDRLMPSPTDAAFREACAEVTGGNPLLLIQLARALRAQGITGAARDAGRVRGIGPAPVAWSLAATLRRLPEGAEAAARAVAVLGPDADLDTATALAALPDASVFAALQEAGLLAAGERLAVVHPLVAEALLQAQPVTARQLLHRHAAEVLAARGRTLAAAEQLRRAPPGGAGWAVAALLEAASAAIGRADPAAAVALLDRALAEPPPDDARPAVLAAAARAQRAAADPRAVASFRAAIGAATTPDDKARLLVDLSNTLQQHGRYAEAVAAAQAGLVLDPDDDGIVAALHAMRDSARVWSPRDAPADIPAPTESELDDPQARRIALAQAARAHVFAGDVDHDTVAGIALRAWDRGALLRATTAEDPSPIRVLTALHNTDRLSAALEVAEACLADADQRALPMAQATWHHLRGHVLSYMGRLPEAEEELAWAFDARHRGWGSWLPVTANALVLVRLDRGDLEGAARAAEEAEASSTHPPESLMWALTQAAVGRLLLRQGDPEAALPELLEAMERGTEGIGAHNPAMSTAWSDAAVALHRLGRPDEALAYLRPYLAAARRFGAPRALAAALRTLAEVGPAEDRLGHLQDARAVVAGSEAQLEHLRVLVDLGAAEREEDAERARETLRRALDLADRLGADALAADAHRELLAAGGRPRRRQSTGPASLTDGELRVARMAAAGETNKAIATALVVSPKAVSFHLGNVYRKLGITGRRDLPKDL